GLPLYTASAYTSLSKSFPSRCQVVPFHAATLLAKVVPAIVNRPPTTSSSGCGPGPSGSQSNVALTTPLIPGTPSPGNHRPHCAVARGCTHIAAHAVA